MGRAERCAKFFRNKNYPILESLKNNKNGMVFFKCQLFRYFEYAKYYDR